MTTKTSHPNPTNLYGVTKEFLEETLNRKWGSTYGNLQVNHFTVAQGSLSSEGYTTMLLTVQVWLKETDKFSEIESNLDWFSSSTCLTDTSEKNEILIESPPSLNLVIKCYPDNEAKQHYLETSDIFRIELGVYEAVMPQLVKFQEDLNVTKILRPPIPYFVAGEALTLGQMKELKKTRPLQPLDNYVMMLNLQKHGHFFLRNRFLSLDLDHHKLILEAQAQLHAISWAYKVTQGLTQDRHLRSKFSFLQKGQMQDNLQMMKQVLKTNIQLCKTIVSHELKGDVTILKGLEELQDQILTAFILYYEYDPQFDPDLITNDDEELMELNPKKYTKDSILRIPGPSVDNEDPWLVLLHGDAWSNNIMFKYDQVTKKPVQAVLLDFQISREGDPLSDLAYSIYMGTTHDYRTNHLDTMLHHYFDTFLTICHQLSVPPLPGFTWTEFSRRFHRAKMYGLATAILSLPIILKNPDLTATADLEAMSISDLDEGRVWAKAKLEEPKNVVRRRVFQIYNAEAEYGKLNPVLKQRLSDLLRDMAEEGVL